MSRTRSPLEEIMQANADAGTALRDVAEKLFGSPAAVVLYGLPHSLIEAIRQEAASIISPPELDFEMKLAAHLRRHFSVGLIDGKFAHSSLFEARSPMSISPEDIEELGWEEQGLTHAKANQLSAEVESRAVLFHEQLVGYAGWLITNPTFLADVAALRDREQDYLAATTAEDAAPFIRDMNAFLIKWQLAGMVTWDLPEPQGPNLSGIELPAAARRGAPAVMLAFPLSTRLPARFPMRELVSEIRGQAAEPHLGEWRKILDQERRNAPGMQRCRHFLHLRFFRDIVLASRYGQRFRGNVEALDRVFGTYLELNAETTKTLRLEIEKRLNPA